MDKAKTRRRKVPANLLRAAIARNVTARAAIVFKDHPNKVVAISDASARGGFPKLTRSTIQRIMEGTVTSATLEQLDGLGRALELEPYQLLIKDLNPTNPQVAKAVKVEKHGHTEAKVKAANGAGRNDSAARP